MGHPPHTADSQSTVRAPYVAPRDTTAVQPDELGQLDSINLKAEILNEKTVELNKKSVELERATYKLLRAIRKGPKEEVVTEVLVVEGSPDTVVIKEPECVYIRDSVYSNLSWWRKYGILLKQCTIPKKVSNFFKRSKK